MEGKSPMEKNLMELNSRGKGWFHRDLYFGKHSKQDDLLKGVCVYCYNKRSTKTLKVQANQMGVTLTQKHTQKHIRQTSWRVKLKKTKANTECPRQRNSP
eukprot:sb/3478565/